jgi:hypothetical protein
MELSEATTQSEPESPKSLLRTRVAPVGGELVEAGRLPVILRKPTPTGRVENTEIVLRDRVALIGGELVEAGRLPSFFASRHSFL